MVRSNKKNKLKKRYKPGYLRLIKKKDTEFLYFKPIDLPNMIWISFFWIGVSLVFAYLFNKIRIPGALLNLDEIWLQLFYLFSFFYFFYKGMVLWTNKVIIKITPKMLMVKEKKTPLSSTTTKFRVRKNDAFDFYVDFRRGIFLTSHVLMVLTSKQKVEDVIIATSPNLVNFLEFSITNHRFVKDIAEIKSKIIGKSTNKK